MEKIQASGHVNLFLPLSRDMHSANTSVLPLERFHTHTNPFVLSTARRKGRAEGEQTHTMHLKMKLFPACP